MCLYNYMYIDCTYLSKNMTLLVKLLSGVRLFVIPWTVAHQALPSMGFFQARVLEWGAISFSRGASQSRDGNQVSHIAGRHLTV